VAEPRYLTLSRPESPTPPSDEGADVPRRVVPGATGGDRVYRVVATGAALTSLLIVGGTAIFLLREAKPAITSTGVRTYMFGHVWNASAGKFGVGGLVIGTVIIAAIALGTAVPLALGLALFINEYAPNRLRSVLTSVVDLLAAIPSLVFGIWGLFALQGRMVPIAKWFGAHLSAIPIFRLTSNSSLLVASAFVAGTVVGIMILPIITSVSRDVMAQCPREQVEGALALGGTRWGMIRAVMLPFGKSGIIGATLLGFGRALGETIAVALLISIVYQPNWHVLESGAGSVAAVIAVHFGEATALERSGLVAAGLALFFLTIAVNLVARQIVNRSVRSSASS